MGPLPQCWLSLQTTAGPYESKARHPSVLTIKKSTIVCVKKVQVENSSTPLLDLLNLTTVPLMLMGQSSWGAQGGQGGQATEVNCAKVLLNLVWSGRQKQLVWNGFCIYRIRWVLCWFVYCIYAYIHWKNVGCHACERMVTRKVESSAGRIRNILSCIWMYKCRPRKYCCPFSRQKPIWLSWSTKLTNLLNYKVI